MVVVVVGATVVVVVGATVVVVVVGATVVVVVGATVVVVVVGATVVVVVVGATVVVVVVGATVVVVVVGATVVVVVVGATVVVVVVGATVVVVVVDTGAAGIVIVRNAWFPTTLLLSVATRIWQLVKSGTPLFGDGSPGARQLNLTCGLGPLIGKKPKLGSLAGKVAIPSTPTSTAAGDVAESQWSSGFHPGVLDATPSHCSMLTAPMPAG